MIALLILLQTVLAGRVRPYGSQSVTMSNVNANGWSEYNFTMTLDTTLPSNGIIEITFPTENYPDWLGLGSAYLSQVFAPYPTTFAAITINGPVVQIPIGAWPVTQPLVVTIQNIVNSPKVGGTGNFMIRTGIPHVDPNNAANTIIYYVDINDHFAVIGLAPQTLQILKSAVTISNNIAGQTSNYTISITPSTDITSAVSFVIEFPLIYTLGTVRCVANLFTPTCVANNAFLNWMVITGSSAKITKGTLIQIVLYNIVNPSRQMQTPLFQFRIVESGTNNTIEHDVAVPGLTILPGVMTLVKLSPLQYAPFTSYVRNFKLQFRPTNMFTNARISTGFYQITSCTITSGLLDLTQYQDSSCQPLGKMMFLSQFQPYVQSTYSYTYVEVTFTARINDNLILNAPIQIYTYQDEGWLELADEDIASTASEVQLIGQPPSLLNLPTPVTITISSPTTIVSSANTITVTSTILTSYLQNCLMALEIPSLFSGIPSCFYTNGGAVVVNTLSCTFSSGFLNVTLPSMLIGSPVLQITGLISPPYGGAYSIRVLLYANLAATPTAAANITQTITVPQFPPLIVPSPVTNLQSFPSAIDFIVTIPQAVPAGVKNLQDPFVAYSVIELQFPQLSALGTNTWAGDLGLGLTSTDPIDIGCQFANVSAAQGNKLQCILFPVGFSASTSALVKVFGYQAQSAGGIIEFKVPVMYPSTASAIPLVKVALVRYDSKIRTVIAQSTFSVSPVSTNAGTVMNVANVQAVLLGTNKLQSTTSLTYKFKTTISVSPSSANGIYYQMPTGYTFNYNAIQISIDGFYLDKSYIQMFTAFTPATLTNFIFILLYSPMSSGQWHTLIIENVQLPKSLQAAPTHVFKTSYNGQFAETTSFTMPTLTAGSLYGLTIAVDQQISNHPYANYSIQFTTTLQSPKGSVIVITFPGSYNLLSSSPYLDNIPFCNLQNTSSTTVTGTAISATQFRVSGFKTYSQGQTISLGLYSIQNPSSGTYTITVQVQDSNGYLIEGGTQLVKINTTLFTLQTFTISTAQIPNNANQNGLYQIKSTLPFTLPKLSTINLAFTGFAQLYSYPSLYQIQCRIIQNGIQINLRQCDLFGSSILIQLDQKLDASAVTIEYYGLTFPTSSPATISASVTYNSINIASAAVVTVTTVSTGTQVPVTLTFYPRNEGEVAYYIFTMQVDGIIQSTSQIFVRFPIDYDPIIGIDSLQVTSTALTGALQFTLKPQHIFITGFYTATIKTLDIRILGIINPNRNNNQATGTFAFGILTNGAISLGNFSIPGIIPQLAPQTIQLGSIVSQSKFARYYTDYTFVFTPLQDVLSTVFGGQLIIDFPNDFVIDHFSGSCSTQQNFSNFASCNWDYFRFTFVTNNQNWAAGHALQLIISNVLTPDNTGTTSNFVIYNYDSINQIVLGRTYGNLEESSLIFTYDGLQIDVNNKLPYVLEVGSYSDPIIMNITNPTSFTVTLTPNVLDATIIVTPNPVQIAAGSTQATFTLAAPRTILLKTFYIQWSKTGDPNPTFAPLRLTPVQMVSGTLTRTLTVEQMAYIPLNGTSYPLYITTKNPPYQQILITLSFYSNYTRKQHLILDSTLQILNATYTQVIQSGVQLANISMANLSTTQLSMQKLQYSASYNFNTSFWYNLSTVTLYMQIQGYDSASFQLNIPTLVIPTQPQQYRNPNILAINILNVTRSTASFQVIGDTIGFIYYVYADQHMPDPTFNGTQFPIANSTLDYSKPIYGVNYIRSSTLDVNFTISNLLDYHDYELFVFMMNMNGVSNPTFKKVYCQTLRSQKIALMTLKIMQTTLDPNVALGYIQKMATIIEIDASRIVQRTTTCTQTALDVSPSSSYLYWNLMIMPDTSNMNPLTTPLALAQALNNQRTTIATFITRLDSDPFYTLNELADNVPNFVISPQMVDRTTLSISVQFKISYCGIVFLSIRARPNSTALSLVNSSFTASQLSGTQLPSAYQIKNGLNETNAPMNSTKIVVTNTQQFYSINYTQLNVQNIYIKQSTVYDVFFSMQNDFPTNQLLYSNNSVTRWSAKTLKVIVPLNIYSMNIALIIMPLIIIII